MSKAFRELKLWVDNREDLVYCSRKATAPRTIGPSDAASIAVGVAPSAIMIAPAVL